MQTAHLSPDRHSGLVLGSYPLARTSNPLRDWTLCLDELLGFRLLVDDDVLFSSADDFLEFRYFVSGDTGA